MPFLQLGISIPVSKDFDVFALVSALEERYDIDEGGSDLSMYMVSFRAGVAWKFF